MKGVATILTVLLLAFLLRSHAMMWLLTLASIYSILTLSWLFMRRYSGYTSLGHSIPFGISAYLFVFAGFPAILISTLISTFIFSILSTFSRHKFIFMTFVAGVLFWLVSPHIVVELNGVVYGGEEGFTVEALPLNCSFAASSILLLLSLTAIVLFDKSRYGIQMLAVASDEVAAYATGVDVPKLKLACMAASSFVASVAGALYALFFGHVSPEVYGIEVAIFPFIASLFSYSPTNVVVASFALTALTRGSLLVEYHLLIYAALLMLSPKLRWRNA